MGWRSTLAALLGISAYTPPAPDAAQLGDPEVDRIRSLFGGQLQILPQSQTRWYLADLEAAIYAADQGFIAPAARLMRAARGDGHLAGVLSTRTEGLVRLPKRFRGNAEAIGALKVGEEDARSVFDEMFPASELGVFTADFVSLGVAIGELVPVEGRDYPVFVRLDPEFLQYRWYENRWYFRSIAGPIPITPGDGRWVLATLGRSSPWQNGNWRALGKAFIRKEHAQHNKDNWEAKLAQPARVAVAPAGASEEQAEGWFKRVLAWGKNTVFGMRPGYDVKLLESNGRGADSFVATISEQNGEITICIAGQTVTTDGGVGFANADIHKSIRADLIKATADALAYVLNTQGIPPWLIARWGDDALTTHAVVVEWDVTPPADLASGAQALVSVASALSQLTSALAAHGLALDVSELCTRFGVPVKGPLAVESAPKKLDLAPTDLAKVVKVREARSSQGLPPFGDDRDEKTVTQLGEEAAVDATATAAPATLRVAA